MSVSDPGSIEPTAPALGSLLEQYGSSRVLLSDLRTALLLANHARHRTLQRLFGLPPGYDDLLTLIGLTLLANAAQNKARRLLAPGAVPAPGDYMFGAVSLREVMSTVAGPALRDTPHLGTLIMLAFVGGTSRVALVRGLRGLRKASHGVAAGFHHRYGYLVDPGHRRQRRAAVRGQ